MARNQGKEKFPDGAAVEESEGAVPGRKVRVAQEGGEPARPGDAGGLRAASPKAINRNGIWKEKTSRHGECWRFFISWYDSRGRRCRRKGSGFRTKDEAQRAVDKIRADARNERLGLEIPKPVKPTTIGEAVDAYVESRRNKRAARRQSQNPHARTNYSPLNRLRDWEGFVGRDTLARTINEDSFLKWVAREKKRGLTLSSINRSITTIIACLHHARRNNEDMRGYVIPPRPIKKSAENKRTRILVEEEIVKISNWPPMLSTATRSTSSASPWAAPAGWTRCSASAGATSPAPRSACSRARLERNGGSTCRRSSPS